MAITEDDFQPYHHRRHELAVEDNCLLWGHRVVVPQKGREQVLQLLHDSHPGMNRMKALARSIVFDGQG